MENIAPKQQEWEIVTCFYNKHLVKIIDSFLRERERESESYSKHFIQNIYILSRLKN